MTARQPSRNGDRANTVARLLMGDATVLLRFVHSLNHNCAKVCWVVLLLQGEGEGVAKTMEEGWVRAHVVGAVPQRATD